MDRVESGETPSAWYASVFGSRRGRNMLMLMVIVGLCSVTLFWQMEVGVNFGRVLQTGFESSQILRGENTAHIDAFHPDFHQPVPLERVINISTTSKPKSSKPLVVLLWTSNVTRLFPGDIANLMNKCYTQSVLTEDQVCEFTDDRSRLEEADALLFRVRGLKLDDLPKKRNARQHYVMFEQEPPHKTWRFINLTQYNGFFNITSTYAWDSDIPLGAHRTYVVDSAKYEAVKDVDFAAKKRTDVPVAWFVSRCPTQSKREDYVKEMQKYIGVDVYGKCGTLQCTLQGKHFSDDVCVRTLLEGNNSYKFYLAFENSLCEDYVTEKIWKVVSANVLPVVMGAIDYKRVFPPKTFIDVRDFKSPKNLANFLLHLHHNDAEYNDYMRRKAAMISTVVGNRGMQCSFCKGLHSYRGKRSIVYALDEAWGSKKCTRPKVFLEYHAANDFGFNLKDIGSRGTGH